MSEISAAIVGHDAALSEIEAAYRSGRMHHAWLLCGIEGIGKSTLAKQIAHFVLAKGQTDIGKPDLTRRSSKLIEAEAHPDLLVIRRPLDDKTGNQRAMIPVEEVLRIATFLHMTASEGGWRVVIIDEAHTLNRNGQNAILKIVEEPPPQTLILITVTTPGALLPTIRSRARLLPLQPLEAAALRDILSRAAPQALVEDIAALIELSGGSAGFALKILRAQALPLYKEMLAILDTMPKLDMARLHKLADQIAKKADAESFDVVTSLLIERLRAVAHQEAARHPQGRVDLALQIWEKTRATLASVDNSNLDRKLAFINAITDIRSSL